VAHQIVNVNSADGYTALETTVFGIDGPVEASAAITAKTILSVGTDGRFAMAATDGTASLSTGVALKAIASGDTGLVRFVGAVSNVPATGAISAGDLLKRSVTTTGSVSATATPAAGEVIGVAMAASASNVVKVWLTGGKALS